MSQTDDYARVTHDEAHEEASDSRHIRPATYYGEGPFEPPSSDEEDELLEKIVPGSPGLAERAGVGLEEDGGLVVGGPKHKRTSHLRCLLISLVALVLLAGCIGVLAAMSYTGTAYHVPGAKHITMDHVFNGTFNAQKQSLNWVPEAGDGVFSIAQDGYIKLVDLKTNTTKDLVALKDIKDEHGSQLQWSGWQLSADMKYILVKADYRKQWRHSSFGNYYVHNLESKDTHPITPPTSPPDTAYAAWSPTGEAIAYVKSNDLYILPTPDPSATPIRVTTAGNASLFHGVPDWVYEEEVFSADFALWWAPDSTKLAFLRLDETRVDEFVFPVYNPTEDAAAVVPYTSEVRMKYPKPGFANPDVSVHVFDLAAYTRGRVDATLSGAGAGVGAAGFPAANATLELAWAGRHATEDSVVMEVAWVGNGTLLVKEVNRAADAGSVVLFDLAAGSGALGLASSEGRVVRKLGKDGEEGDDGWIDSSQTVYRLPDALAPAGGAYLDIVPTPEGYNHIALYSPASATMPRFLTVGPWEVTGGIKAIDAAAGLVYFQAANPSSIERHIYAVPLPATGASKATEPTALTDASVPAFFSADFSPGGGFHLLSYDGPGVPWQKVTGQGNWSLVDYVLTENEGLNKTMQEFEAPIVTRSTIESEGFEMNVLEMRPPRMDDSGRTKYPVLFKVYGGPGSQEVSTRFTVDWHHYLVCTLQYVVVVVDGRGTGFRGRKFRNPVRNNLGFWEVRDQVAAAKVWAAKDYVDRKRIGIWGWSYGGFMSSKIVEADAGVHSLAMAVAPVTSWKLYDSIYTERYMGTPEANPGGYVNASIADVSAFGRMDYALAHGSGDDNVHFANSAHLLDMLTAARIRGFRFRMFTDSDHSISRRGAYREVFEYLTEFLLEKWGKGGRRRGL